MNIITTTLDWIESKPHALRTMEACRKSSDIGRLEFDGIAEGRKNMRKDLCRVARDFRKSTEMVKVEIKSKTDGKKD